MRQVDEQQHDMVAEKLDAEDDVWLLTIISIMPEI